MKVSTPLNKLLSKASVVLYVITLKLVANNYSHESLTFPINVPISIWVLVLLSQFVPCVIKYSVIACAHLFRTILISFWQFISKYTPVFPNYYILVSFWLIFGFFFRRFSMLSLFDCEFMLRSFIIA